ncbi:MAG: hypothetical protein KJ052_09090, partial [Candidatus Hydrogenedentes bacterium]|nr:hypothetical protein [Candidatus Hydrogenedentota bacterium]
QYRAADYNACAVADIYAFADHCNCAAAHVNASDFGGCAITAHRYSTVADYRAKHAFAVVNQRRAPIQLGIIQRSVAVDDNDAASVHAAVDACS